MTDAPKPNGLRTAVAGVMTDLHRLNKSDINAFAKYNFTSVNDFKDHIRPLMAKHGLSVSVNELDCIFIEAAPSSDVRVDKKPTLLIKFQFAFTLHYQSGESAEPEQSSVILPYTGAQTTGAAKSYAVKEWIKGRFLASSGDTEAEEDHAEQGDYAKANTLSKKEAQATYELLQKEMRAKAAERDPNAFIQWGKDRGVRILALPQDWRVHLRTEFAETLQTMRASEGIDRDAGNGAGEDSALKQQLTKSLEETYTI